MFAHLPDAHGAIELDRVHRFTSDWERAASLRIRRGDSTAADLYDEHGRLHGGTTTRMETAAVKAWWQARQRGETAILAAPSKETVGRLNLRAQQTRIAAGELDVTGVGMRVGSHDLWVGDEIVTRRNHRSIRTDCGLMIRNRDQWTVTRIHPDASLTVSGRSGTVRLPSEYCAQHVDLGYAQTSHAAQGRTVDRSIVVLDGPTDASGVYVPMTRGRHSNDAYIVTDGEQTAVDTFADAISHNWIDQPAVARYHELWGLGPHHLLDNPSLGRGTMPDQQTLSTTTPDQLSNELMTLRVHRAEATRQRDQADRILRGSHRRFHRAADVLERYDRAFRRRGHEGEIRLARQLVENMPQDIRDRTISLERATARLAGIDQRTDRAKGILERELARVARPGELDWRLNHGRRQRTPGIDAGIGVGPHASHLSPDPGEHDADIGIEL